MEKNEEQCNIIPNLCNKNDFLTVNIYSQDGGKMKLSLWILNDYLQKYNPKAQISGGNMEISGVRLLSNEEIYRRSIVYICKAREYLGNNDNRVMCVHKSDYLRFQADDFDEVFNHLLDCFAHFSEWEETCLDLIHSGASLQELLNACSTVFRETIVVNEIGHTFLAYVHNNPPEDVVLTDGQKRSVAYISQAVENHALPMKDILEVRNTKEPLLPNMKAVVGQLPEYETPAILRALTLNGNLWGHLVVGCVVNKPTKGRLQLVDTLGDLVELWLEKNAKSELVAESLSQSLYNLISYNHVVDYNALQSHLVNIGWSIGCKKQFFQAENICQSPVQLKLLLKELSRFKSCISIISDSRIFVIANCDLMEADWYNKLSELLGQTGCYAVSSYYFTDLHMLQQQRELTEVSLSYCARKSGEIYSFDIYILQYILEVIKDNSCISTEHPAISILRKYDAANQTLLLHTLKTVLFCDRNYVLASKELFVHRNTVQYRMEKILELTGIDLDKKETRLHLMLELYNA